MSYFDIDKIKSSEYFLKVFGKGLIDENISEENIYSYLENRLLKRASAVFRMNNMKELFENCGNQEKLQELARVFQKEDIEKED